MDDEEILKVLDELEQTVAELKRNPPYDLEGKRLLRNAVIYAEQARRRAKA